MTPSAQFITLCGNLNQYIMKLDEIKARVVADAMISDFMKACIIISINYGLRVSETLLLGGNEIMSNGNIFLTAPKNKEVIVINVSCLGSLETAFRRAGYNLGEITDRFYMYRLYKRLGIVYQKKGNKNKSVTHAFRHIQAQEIRNKELGDILITKALHHKSKKSAESYGT